MCPSPRVFAASPDPQPLPGCWALTHPLVLVEAEYGRREGGASPQSTRAQFDEAPVSFAPAGPGAAEGSGAVRNGAVRNGTERGQLPPLSPRQPAGGPFALPGPALPVPAASRRWEESGAPRLPSWGPAAAAESRLPFKREKKKGKGKAMKTLQCFLPKVKSKSQLQWLC